MNLDPITNKIMADAMGDRSHLTPEQRAERERQDRMAAIKIKCKLRPEDRVSVLRAMTIGDDGSWLIEVVEHLRAMAYYDGLSHGVDNASAAIKDTLARYTDTGDGVPLAVLGQGDFERKVMP